MRSKCLKDIRGKAYTSRFAAAEESTILNILEMGKNRLGAGSAGIMFFEPALNKLVLQYPAFDAPRKLVDEYKVSVNRPGNAARVFRTGQGYLSNHARGDPNIIQKYVNMYNVKNIITVPISVGKKTIGVWHLINKNGGNWEEADLRRFCDIASSVGVLLEQEKRYQKLRDNYENHLDVLQEIVNEGTLEGAIEALGGELGCPLIIYNQDFQCLVKYVPDIDYECLVSLWEHNLSSNKQLVDKIRTGTRWGPYCVSSSLQKNMPCPVWVVSLCSKLNTMGYLVLLETNPLDDLSSLFLKDWATVFSLYLSYDRRVWQINERLALSFLERLVAGTIDEQQALLYATYLGLDLKKKSLFILVVPDADLSGKENFDGMEIIQDIREELCLKLNKCSASAWVGLLGSGLAIIVRAADGLPLSRIVDAIQESLGALKGSFSVGIGPVCSRPADYPQAYKRALQAVHVGRRLFGPGRVTDHATLGSYALLYEAKQEPAADFFVEQVLGPIIKYDQKHNTELLRTLSEYFASNGSLSRTAKNTYLHINTVRYRLSRIEELTERSLRNSQDCFDFQLALRIYRISAKQ